jgi:hypothetical protein
MVRRQLELHQVISNVFTPASSKRRTWNSSKSSWMDGPGIGNTNRVGGLVALVSYVLAANAKIYGTPASLIIHVFKPVFAHTE